MNASGRLAAPPGGAAAILAGRRLGGLFGAVALAAIVAYGMGSGVRSEVVILLYVYALLGAGLYVPLVLTDQVSLGYGAYFGIGAYTFAVVSARGLFDPVLAVPLGMILAGTMAGIVAMAMSRLSGYFLAVGTLLVAIVFSRVLLEANDVTGGPTGLGFEPVLLGFRVTRGQLLIAAAVVVWVAIMAVSNLRESVLGNALQLMSHSRAAAESVGLRTTASRVVSLCVGASLASLAGSVFALSQSFVLPDSFGLEIAFLILFIPIIGGVDSPWGCLIGAALVAVVLQLAPDFGPSRLLFGIAVLGIVLLFPGGIIKAMESLLDIARAKAGIAKGGHPSPPAQEANPAEPDSAPLRESGAAPPTQRRIGKVLLRVEGIGKNFGGVSALRSVSFELREREVLGIVGPNGAGKSTLVDIVTGVQPPDTGRVVLEGRELVAGTASRAIMGMSRTFQHPLLAQELDIRQNLRLGLLRNGAPTGGFGMFAWFVRSMLFGRREQRFSIRATPESAAAGDIRGLENAGGLLLRDFNTQASDVSYAVEKITEVIRALISRPRVLVMDEPFAGLDPASVRSLWETLLRWRTDSLGTIVVDHNIDLLREICDRMVVLDQGAVIAEGAPGEVLRNADVRRAYFGESRP